MAERFFLRIFIFQPPDFFVDFVAGYFLLIFVGKNAQKNPPGNPRQDPPNFVQRKSPTIFCRGARPTFAHFDMDNVEVLELDCLRRVPGEGRQAPGRTGRKLGEAGPRTGEDKAKAKV